MQCLNDSTCLMKMAAGRRRGGQVGRFDRMNKGMLERLKDVSFT